MEQKKGIRLGWIVTLLFWLAVGSLVFQIFSCRVAISQKEQELTQVTARLAQKQAENDELSRTLSGSMEAIVEQVARDELGYAQPNERVFVDVSGKQ